MTNLEAIREQLRRGEYRAALRRIEALNLDPEFPAGRRAELYTLAVHAEFCLRQVHAAAKWADRAVEAAELWGSWEDVGRARLMAGIAYLELGDSARALQWLELFLAHLDRYPSLQSQVAVAYYNLGVVRRMRKEYAAALDAYDQVFQSAQASPDICFRSHHNKAWLLLLLDRPDEAVPHIQAAGDLLPAEGGLFQAMHLCLRALYLQRTGRTAESVALCEEVLGRTDLPPSPLAAAAWVAAENALRTGMWAQAQAFLDAALHYALEAREPAVMNLVADARRRLAALRALAQPERPAGQADPV